MPCALSAECTQKSVNLSQCKSASCIVCGVGLGLPVREEAPRQKEKHKSAERRAPNFVGEDWSILIHGRWVAMPIGIALRLQRLRAGVAAAVPPLPDNGPYLSHPCSML